MRTRDTDLNKALCRATLPDAGTFGDLFESHLEGRQPMNRRLRNLIMDSALLVEDPNTGTECSLPNRLACLSESALEAGWVPEKQAGIYRELIEGMQRLKECKSKDNRVT